jgi:hypothetical protein
MGEEDYYIGIFLTGGLQYRYLPHKRRITI